MKKELVVVVVVAKADLADEDLVPRCMLRRLATSRGVETASRNSLTELFYLEKVQ